MHLTQDRLSATRVEGVLEVHLEDNEEKKGGYSECGVDGGECRVTLEAAASPLDGALRHLFLVRQAPKELPRDAAEQRHLDALDKASAAELRVQATVRL